MSNKVKFAVLVCLLALLGANALGQGIFATLTGVVSDPSNAMVKPSESHSDRCTIGFRT